MSGGAAIRVRCAQPSDMGEIVALYDALVDAMVASGTNFACWKKHIYPGEQTAAEGIAAHTLHVAEQNGSILGAVILDHWQPPAYASLPWQVRADAAEVLVVHTLAVHPDRFQKGIAQELLGFADGLARVQGCRAIRLDVTQANGPANRLYEKCGFVRVGAADLGYGFPELGLLNCYEKLVSAHLGNACEALAREGT